MQRLRPTQTTHLMADTKPYRMVTTFKRTSIYGRDDQGQERYLGAIYSIALDKHFISHVEQLETTDSTSYDSLDEAAGALYEKLYENGYLRSDHPNYLDTEKLREVL